MITLLSAPLPQAYSLLSPSLSEVVALALILAPVALLALVVAAAVLAMAGTVNTAVKYLAVTSAYRLAMPLTHRHAASPSLDARTSRPWDGRSSRKGSWFTLVTSVLLLNFQDLTLVGSVNY
jgi:hypothetical protein